MKKSLLFAGAIFLTSGLAIAKTIDFDTSIKWNSSVVERALNKSGFLGSSDANWDVRVTHERILAELLKMESFSLRDATRVCLDKCNMSDFLKNGRGASGKKCPELCSGFADALVSVNNELTETGTIQKDDNGDIVVAGVPADLLVYSPNPDYELPEHYGWELNKIHIYVAYLFMFIVVGLIISILIGVIRGLHTGNIFRHNYAGQLRWLAVVSFIFILLLDNRNVFHQVAIQQCYNETSPITLNGQIEISPLTLLAPLLLFIFAEVMAIAAKMNEEESMTI